MYRKAFRELNQTAIFLGLDAKDLFVVLICFSLVSKWTTDELGALPAIFLSVFLIAFLAKIRLSHRRGIFRSTAMSMVGRLQCWFTGFQNGGGSNV